MQPWASVFRQIPGPCPGWLGSVRGPRCEWPVAHIAVTCPQGEKGVGTPTEQRRERMVPKAMAGTWLSQALSGFGVVPMQGRLPSLGTQDTALPTSAIHLDLRSGLKLRHTDDVTMDTPTAQAGLCFRPEAWHVACRLQVTAHICSRFWVGIPHASVPPCPQHSPGWRGPESELALSPRALPRPLPTCAHSPRP